MNVKAAAATVTALIDFFMWFLPDAPKSMRRLYRQSFRPSFRRGPVVIGDPANFKPPIDSNNRDCFQLSQKTRLVRRQLPVCRPRTIRSTDIQLKAAGQVSILAGLWVAEPRLRSAHPATSTRSVAEVGTPSNGTGKGRDLRLHQLV